MSSVRALGRLAIALGVIVLLAAGAGDARAQIGSERYAAVVLNAANGSVMTAMNPDAARYPASLTKMMTLYMVFEALREGRLTLNQRIEMTETAAEMPPSKLGIPPGVGITVEQGILALVTKSANDVAALFGETLGGGSEQRFGQMMTMRARAIGMSNTTFRNASGLPNPEQMTTARDMATLGLRLIRDFPERYGYFSTVRTRVVGVQLRNHNRMLDSYEGADGIKTGFINASGFNIVTSAVRPRPDGEKVRLIAAVFGGSSWVERDRHAASLLDQAFARSGVEIGGTAVASRSAPGVMASARAASRPAAARSATAARAPARNTRTVAAARPATRTAARPAATPTRQAANRGTAARNARPTTQAAAAPTRSTLSRTAAVRPPVRRELEQGDGGRLVAVPARQTAKPLPAPVKRSATASRN